MGIVLAFAVGYVVGANAGERGYQEVLDSLQAVLDSAEFHGLIGALRSHASATLRELSIRVADEPSETPSPTRLVERVRDLMGRAGVTSPAP